MASGETVVEVEAVTPPATLGATIDYRTGGSTPNELWEVYDFDSATTEYLDFKCALSGYGGGGLTFTIAWAASTATSGTCQWEIGIRRLVDDAEDMDASHTYDFNLVSDTAASASGEPSYITITFTNGADMDSWANGEAANVRLRRNTAGTDSMAGDAELISIIGRET